MNTRPAALEAALRRAKPERWENLMGTIAETWIEQGEAKGKAVGIAEGEARGKAETFLRLARLRFGDLPEPRVDAVRTASPAQIDRWLEPLLSAENLEDIFRVSRSDQVRSSTVAFSPEGMSPGVAATGSISRSASHGFQGTSSGLDLRTPSVARRSGLEWEVVRHTAPAIRDNLHEEEGLSMTPF